MSFHAYKEQNFKPDTLMLIDECNEIIRKWQRDGYTLTVRQLYYQLVARGTIENTLQSYKRTADMLNNARMAGLVRWDAIEDRTREFVERQRWTSPRQILQASYNSYHMDLWKNQDVRVFIIVEKEALVGVLEPVSRRFDVPLLAARGYPSSSVMREFAVERVMPTFEAGQDVIVLHLGDHDPSGIDMTRDLDEKIKLFSDYDNTDQYFEVVRIALTMDQINDQRPPPNPAKSTDSRFAGYSKLFGDQSWELDALSPQFIDRLTSEHIKSWQDMEKWQEREAVVAAYKAEIKDMASKVSSEPEDNQEDDGEDI